ncbi:hypothetical protein HA466_0089300 [Hirschfeldia incana]|nr:hypothetical protein HA466_0089300 [Hirschfeldia incana]
MCVMALSDAVLGNLATIYVAVIIAINVSGIVSGTSFGAGFVVVVSIMAVGVLLAVTLAWDVARRAADAVSRYNHVGVVEDLSRRQHHHTKVVEFVKEGFAGTELRFGLLLLMFGLGFSSTYRTVLSECIA